MDAQLSVLLPVYNAATTLQQAIESIRAQNFRAIEILIWNDGSTDGSETIIAKAAANDQRIRTGGSTTNKGIVSALNELVNMATTPVLARMDADDRMHPDRLAKQFAFLQHHPDCALVSSWVEHGGNSHSQQGYAAYIDWINSITTAEEIRLNRFVESPLAHPSVVFRATAISQYGGYRSGDFPEDYELWLRWLDAGAEFQKIPEVLLTWNDLPERLSRNDQRYRTEAFHKIKASYLAREIKRIVDGRAIWLCGAGRITRKRSNYLLQEGIHIAGYIDVNPALTGKMVGDFLVIPPEQIPTSEECIVVSYISNRGARSEIAQMLENKGFVNGKDYILAG